MLSTKLNDVEDEQTRSFIMDHMSSFIRGVLEGKLFPGSINDIQALCIVQPHKSKKDILYTTLSFASVIADQLGIPYLFSTDSDSSMVPGSLGKIFTSLEADANIGGVSGHLRFQNPRATYLTRMTSSHYWFEQEIPKAQGAFFGATECQPGPCAAFRVSVLKSVLVPWYCQRTCGHKTVCRDTFVIVFFILINLQVTNEDRHLTTRVLWAGFAVQYAPGAMVVTDAPDNFDAWVKQQVSRSRKIEAEFTLGYMISLLTALFVHRYDGPEEP